MVSVEQNQIINQRSQQRPRFSFGRIRAELYRIGQPIGPYDMMIAGHARASGLILATNNVKEFVRIPGLLLENWAKV